MKKGFLIISTVLLFAISFGSVYAEPTKEELQQKAGDSMVKLGLLKGYEDGSLGLDKSITRAEFAMIITRMLGYDKNPIKISSEVSFKDLKKNHWAYTAVRTCASLGYIKGYENKTFRPSNQITYAEAITVMVRVLGYGKDLKGTWPDNFLNKAKGLGIDKNLEVVAKEQISRGNISILVTNSVTVKIKQ